jgi:hypothetical protein
LAPFSAAQAQAQSSSSPPTFAYFGTRRIMHICVIVMLLLCFGVSFVHKAKPIRINSRHLSLRPEYIAQT